MKQNLRPDPLAISVELNEWDEVGPACNKGLEGISFAANTSVLDLTQALRGALEIHEGHKGVEIVSTSFVGRVNVGPCA